MTKKHDTKKIDAKKQTDTTYDELVASREELKEVKEKLLRCYADFDNYKKRNQKDKQYNEFLTKKNYLLELLDIKELLLTALDDNDPKKGLQMLLNRLEKFFESENIKYIDCIENPFNHELHHAVATIDKPEIEDNIIIEEVKKGYRVGDQVLRPSHVIVSKKKCEEKKQNE
jgi:molecular chaperone GrpE